MYPLALCAPCFVLPAGCRGHRREMWGHVPCLYGKLRRQGGKAQPRPSQAKSDRAQALWPHVLPRLGRLQVSLPGAQVRPWLLAPASLWPSHPGTPFPQESECCQVLQPVSPAGLGPGSLGRGTCRSAPPQPHGPWGPRLPRRPTQSCLPLLRCVSASARRGLALPTPGGVTAPVPRP